ncbi:hypothetical protein GH714_028834 [Hevea brasiliensis]|uniref:Uncharacterized protein n=1 Tax=Hevea brasiliensis TaxID=3981 RepID=A0A6A6NJP7_HEVBR|nr:hypothetical protein GH714_028834 [Hevea brasiliensis]
MLVMGTEENIVEKDVEEPGRSTSSLPALQVGENGISQRHDVDDAIPSNASHGKIKRGGAGYDPLRIPSAIFETNKTTSPVDWSIASNDSLFSLQLGNSFSRERKPAEVELQVSPSLPVSVADTECRVAVADTDNPPSVPMEEIIEETTETKKAEEATGLANETTSKDATKPGDVEDTKERKKKTLAASCKSKNSDKSGESNHSFTFPVKRSVHGLLATVPGQDATVPGQDATVPGQAATVLIVAVRAATVGIVTPKDCVRAGVVILPPRFFTCHVHYNSFLVARINLSKFNFFELCSLAAGVKTTSPKGFAKSQPPQPPPTPRQLQNQLVATVFIVFHVILAVVLRVTLVVALRVAHLLVVLAVVLRVTLVVALRVTLVVALRVAHLLVVLAVVLHVTLAVVLRVVHLHVILAVVLHVTLVVVLRVVHLHVILAIVLHAIVFMSPL